MFRTVHFYVHLIDAMGMVSHKIIQKRRMIVSTYVSVWHQLIGLFIIIIFFLKVSYRILKLGKSETLKKLYINKISYKLNKKAHGNWT